MPALFENNHHWRSRTCLGWCFWLLFVWGGVFLASPVSAAGVLVAPAKQSVSTQTEQDLLLKFQITNQEVSSQRVRVFVQDVSEVSTGGVPKFSAATESAAFRWTTAVNFSRAGRAIGAEKPYTGKASILLEPGQAADVSVTMRVPAAADKAAYFFAVFFEFTDDSALTDSFHSESPVQVLVERRIASLVALTLSDRRPEYELAIRPQAWQFVTQPVAGWALPVEVKNIGSVHQILQGQVTLQTILGTRVQASSELNPTDQWLLPAQSLHLQLVDASLNDWSFLVGRVQAVGVLNGQPFQRRFSVFFLGESFLLAAGGVGVLISLLCIWQIGMIWWRHRYSHKAS